MTPEILRTVNGAPVENLHYCQKITVEVSKIKVVFKFKALTLPAVTDETKGHVNGANGSLSAKNANPYEGSASLFGRLWSFVSSAISWAFQYIE